MKNAENFIKTCSEAAKSFEELADLLRILDVKGKSQRRREMYVDFRVNPNKNTLK